jgi:nitrite reductase/ring-hydroxylating ferredoxin subunit
LLSASKESEGNFVAVARDDRVSEGSMFAVAVAGNAIVLSKIGGKVYAMDAVCSHYNGYLPKGELIAARNTVICPVHKAQFDATTGKVLKNVPVLLKLATHKEATDLRTYEVEVVDGSVRIRV